MKTKIALFSLITILFATQITAQYGRVNTVNNEISDNLDLRAVASLFGDSRNLKDFERRLNDPEIQISNLDLNYDNQVDYLRVIETVEGRTHLIIIQSVLDTDTYQDVATIDVERDNYNRIQVQFIGNEFMYGANYIYEPVYYSTPLIYASFWLNNYRPYISNWCWNYYPSYYYAWNPYPIYRYRSNIQLSINFNNSYNYVTYRSSNRAAILYNSRYSNSFARQYPEYNFSRRHTNYSNRYELDNRRYSRASSSRDENENYRNNSSRFAVTDRYQKRENSIKNKFDNSKGANPKGYEDRKYSNSTRSYSPESSQIQKSLPSSRDNSQRETTPNRSYAPKNSQAERNMPSSRNNSQREATPNRSYSSQSSQSERNMPSSRDNSSKGNSLQRAENGNRNSSSQGNNNRRT